MDERVFPSSLFLVGKSMFLCVPMFVLELLVTSVERLQTSSDIYLSNPTKNLGTLKIRNVTPINVKSWQVYPMFCH